MQRWVTTLLIILTALPALAQRSKATVDPSEAIEAAIEAYDFDTAESLLNTEINRLRRKKQPTDDLEERLRNVHLAMQMLSAVERVVVFDSVIVDRDRFLSALCLGGESGTVAPTSTLIASCGSDDAMLFTPEMADRVFYSRFGNDSTLQLYASDLLGSELTKAEALKGLESEYDTNYPFMMPDGQTLYYAAKGDASLGGYDIFMSRYDPYEHVFFTPENVGMPFNSPANDYMMCVNEEYNVGCFVSDRGMEEGKVCVYYFIPNEVRRVYVEEEVGEELLRQLARLDQISLTWQEEVMVRTAARRLQECRNAQQSQREPDFTFIVAQNHTCHWLSDFRNDKARALAQAWLQDKRKLDDCSARLAAMRESYRNGNINQRAQLKMQILSLEGQVEELSASLHVQEKNIRNTELGLR